ncbi:MAG TPA: sensor histidine kinase, partial [Mucilaginibacter sp.]
CLALRKTEKDSGLLVLTLQNLGSAWKQKNQQEKALGYILRATRIAEKYRMKDEIARGNLDLAELYGAEGKYDMALSCANISGRLATQLRSPELRQQAEQAKSLILERKGRFAGALEAERQSNSLKDSLFNLAMIRTVSETEAKYETRQKDRDIASLRVQRSLAESAVTQQKHFNLALLAAILLLLLLLVIAYRSYRRKIKDHLRIRYLMKDIHHRVKNNLQMLSGLFKLQLADSHDEQVKKSIQENELRLNSMNLIHQQLYQEERDTLIAMKEYLEQLISHIQISMGRNRNIGLTVMAEPLVLEADKAVAIGLIVNELVTNAYKYAFDSDGGEIYVGLRNKAEGIWLLTVRDNGKGGTGDGKGFGLELVKIMAEQLNAVLKVSGPGLIYDVELRTQFS